MGSIVNNTLYTLENIRQNYEGREVLNIDKLILEENQIIGFFGPNGSGKSTLFSILSFIDKAKSGILTFRAKNSDRLTLKEKQSVVIVPQNPYLLKRSVYDNIIYGLKIRNIYDDLDKKVDEALSLVGLDKSFSKRTWKQLSGGEAQRVALAARLILKPKVLILDEPTTGVDTNSAQLIKEAILLAKQKYNTSILISSHDHNWLNHICDKKIALFQGKLIENGNINLLFAPWKKNKDGNLVKVFLDGQRLILENTQNKKRDSIVLINSDDISLVEDRKDALKLSVNSVSSHKGSDEILLELSICGVILNKRVSRDIIKEKQIFPGNEIYVKINSDKLYWL